MYTKIPFRITRKFAYVTFAVLLCLDAFFVAAYLASLLPEIRSLTVNHRLAFLDLNTEANIPTNYAILKLYGTAIMCLLMVFWYKKNSPFFWKIAAVVLFIVGLDESAQLHELWSAGIATKLFGSEFLSKNQYTIIPYSLLLGSFYLTSLTLFPKWSKTVFVSFFFSGICLILSQAGEWAFKPAMKLMFNILNLFSPLLEKFGKSALLYAWEEGLEMVGFSLISLGILLGISRIQENE